jgi:hypothetical protein
LIRHIHHLLFRFGAARTGYHQRFAAIYSGYQRPGNIQFDFHRIYYYGIKNPERVLPGFLHILNERHSISVPNDFQAVIKVKTPTNQGCRYDFRYVTFQKHFPIFCAANVYCFLEITKK